MTLQHHLTCAQCGASIEGHPVGLGEEVFCCLGCVGGGPCICERVEAVETEAPALARASRGAPAIDALLPTRTRFRVFRAGVEAPPGEATSEAQVAELLTSTRDQTRDAPYSPGTAPLPAAGAAQEILVVASRFASFLALNDFQAVLRAITGVTDTSVRRFYGGALTLSVEYHDPVPLVERLRAARGHEWRVSAPAPDRIEITLSEGGAETR